MRIALSVETFLPKIDGIVNIACRTLDFLTDNGIESIIIAPEQGVREYHGVKVIGAPCIVNPVYPEGRVGFPSIGAYNAVRKFKPDLVHAIDPALIGAGAIMYAKILKLPTVASYHLSISRSAAAYGLGAFERPLRAMRVWGFNYVDHALAPSRSAVKLMKDAGVRRVGWWRRGVDSDSFNPSFRSEEMRRRFGVTSDNEIVLLYVGRLAPDKQVEHFKPVLEKLLNVRLVIVGGGPYQKQLEESFVGLPVTFMGYMKGQELATAYASADAFVFASQHESFGLVLAEAIASGLPVVSTRVGGAEDVITNGETGYLVDVGDQSAMTAAIENLISVPDKMRLMGQKARQFAETLTWPNMMTELLVFYENLLEEKGRLTTRRFSSASSKSPLLQPKPM
jgi:glycosyltransferase involved in cell wall biosynthesis